MKKYLLVATLLLSPVIMPSIITNANEIKQTAITQNAIKKFNPVTINYILDGTDTKLKSSKILNDSSSFWSDYTVKFSNTLMYGGIDIQSEIRNYFFSHYEVNGVRIESIDAIIKTSGDSPVVNVVYTKEVQEDGYLRKGFRRGIAIDNNYLLDSIENNYTAYTDLSDSNWAIEFPKEFGIEITKKVKEIPNENDKTLYLNSTASPLSEKDQIDLSKKYNYIDSIKLSSSLEYKDFENNYILSYTLPSDKLDLKNKESYLYGIDLEGKVELLCTSKFKGSTTKFAINKNMNKYQSLFVAEQPNPNIPTDENTTDTSSPTNEEDVTDNTEKDTSKPNTNVVENVQNTETIKKVDESKILSLLLLCFAVGSIPTYIACAIFYKRKENMKKLKEEKE